MYKIDSRLSPFRTRFNSFGTALASLEILTHGDVSNTATVEHLFGEITEKGSIYMGETSEGHLHLVMTHAVHGTSYSAVLSAE